ncbi:MAG: alanine dehydrogenase [Nitrososphaerota archaeon]
MRIGVPKELPINKATPESRVGLTPSCIDELVQSGAEVFVEHLAGMGSGFDDEEFRKAGAKIVYSKEEVYRRSDLIVKIQPPRPEEWSFVKEFSTVMAFHHLITAPREYIDLLVSLKTTVISYENMEERDGIRPVHRISSEIAGKMSPQLAGKFLETTLGGRGILLGGVIGTPPADVVIIGGGTLGYYAARAFIGVGARVHILDINPRRLEELDMILDGKASIVLATSDNVRKYVSFADVVVCAVYVRGQRAPILITRDMMRGMKRGAVIMDFSINQGGCVESARITSADEVVKLEDRVLYFAQPNVPSLVARSSSLALSNALLPYLKLIVENGLEDAIKDSEALRKGTCIFKGKVTADFLASMHHPYYEIGTLIGEVE